MNPIYILTISYIRDGIVINGIFTIALKFKTNKFTQLEEINATKVYTIFLVL